MSSPTGVELLLAERQIRQLALAYADAFLMLDAELMVSLWDDREDASGSGEVDVSWARDLVRRWQGLDTELLHVTNHLVWFDDAQHALGRVFCLAQMDRGAAFVDQSIVYDDRYVCRDGRWLFAGRRHHLWFGEQRPRHPLRAAPARWPSSQVGAGTLRDAVPGLPRAAPAWGRTVSAPEVRVESVAPTDLDAIALSDDALEEADRLFADMYIPPRPGLEVLVKNGGSILVAYVGREPAASGVVKLLEPGIAEIKRMYVSPRWRGRGVGRRLLDGLEAEAAALGCARVRLDTSSRHGAALALYRSAGYRAIDDYNGAPGAEYWLEKRLPRRC